MFRRYLTVAQQTKLLSTIKSHGSLEARRDYGWVSLLRALGLRVGETSLLTCGQARLSLQTKYLFIPGENRKGRRKRIDERDLFGKDPRANSLTALVTREARDALSLLLRVRAEQTGEKHPADDAPLILNRYGERLSVRSFQERLEHWRVEAGFMEPITPHWLRHTRAMNIMRHSQAVDPRGVVKVVLGHASIESTAIYTQPTKEDVAEALDRVDDAVAPMRKRQARRVLSGQLPLGISA